MTSFTYRGETLTVVTGSYSDGSLAVRLEDADGLPYARLSFVLPEQPLPEGEFWLKDWAENEGIAEAFLKSGLAGPTHRTCYLPFSIARSYRLVAEARRVMAVEA